MEELLNLCISLRSIIRRTDRPEDRSQLNKALEILDEKLRSDYDRSLKKRRREKNVKESALIQRDQRDKKRARLHALVATYFTIRKEKTK